MPESSLLLQASFVGLGLIVAAGFVAAVGEAFGPKHARGAAVVVAAWIALAGGLAGMGILRFGPLPPPVMILVTSGLVATIVFACSRGGRGLALGLPLWLLVGYQAFRIPVELMLHRAHVEGLAPIQMTYLGRNFDVLTGISALALGVWLWRAERSVPKVVVWLWNIAGLGLLLNVVGTAIVSMPSTPFRLFHNEPSNEWIAYFPFIWLPTVLVVAALMGHILVFRRLLAGARFDLLRQK